MTIYFFLIVILNFWVWKITGYSLIISIVLLSTTILTFININSLYKNKIVLVFFFLLLFFQYKTNSVSSLTKISEDEIVQQVRRMGEYGNPWIAHFFEERPEAIIFFKVKDNLSQLIDPNFYFFSNHPRERSGIKEFEKFPYILLPFFILGLYRFIKEKKYFLIFTFLIIPISLCATIGLNNPLGPFSLFPFILITSYKGIFKKPLFAIFYILIFLQTLAYAL